ncbi:hypothetical protein PEC301879_31910 [Pectobacterium carotovorum subsp. carotovorum]|nr:hypothetical protein PEC301879_31910 [Pectobacterium carotovorum subsp. carotovorum]
MSTLSSEADIRTQQAPGNVLIFSMAAASGISVANIYYNQPMLGVIGESFRLSEATSLIPTVTQLGYALGLLLLVPLGDKFDRRRLIVWQFLMLALVSAFAALSTSAVALLGASLLIGFGATAAQQIVPAATALADAKQRGAIVGTVMSGLLSGILLSRTVAGLVGRGQWEECYRLRHRIKPFVTVS